MNYFLSGWYVVYTKPRHEKKVSLILAEKRFDYFLPTIKTLRHWHDRKKYIDAPLFPSYVFVYLKDQSGYFSSLSIEGVLNYVRFGKDVARVNETVINNIRLITHEGSQLEVSEQIIQPGEEMVIREGPLTGLTCEVIQREGKQKVLVRMHLLKRNIIASLPAKYLQRSSPELH